MSTSKIRWSRNGESFQSWNGSSLPFSDYKRRPGDRVGLNWRIPGVMGKRAVPPRVDLSTNKSFVEVGTCLVTSSRTERNVHLLPWGDLSADFGPPKSAKAKHDPLARARFYKSLLDKGIVESRAALSRHLGISRARVTQVLKRLEGESDSMT
ncbi:MAG: hypothetical protein KDA86_26895 [Planctomycetaceae bacterium]|nr:hypothetical protein [Planctomycetaceae bacterium]